jgi:hypothetical protein
VDAASPVDEYAEEAAIYKTVLLEHAAAPARCSSSAPGGGNNAFRLKRDFAMTLVDRSEDMLRQSRKINPELPHRGRHARRSPRPVFDAVFIHDAIAYATTRRDSRARSRPRTRRRPADRAVRADDARALRGRTTSGGTDAGRRGFRYLEWSWDPDPDDETAVTDYAFLIRDEHGRSGSCTTATSRPVPRQVWLDTLAAVGFEPRARSTST